MVTGGFKLFRGDVGTRLGGSLGKSVDKFEGALAGVISKLFLGKSYCIFRRVRDGEKFIGTIVSYDESGVYVQRWSPCNHPEGIEGLSNREAAGLYWYSRGELETVYNSSREYEKSRGRYSGSK